MQTHSAACGALAIAAVGSATVAVSRWQRAARREHEMRLTALEATVQHQQVLLREKEAQLRDLREGGSGALVVPAPLYRVVLTGGPCGGKTTALAKLSSRLEELGFLVLKVPETATMLFSGGVPLPHDEASAFVLQKHMLRVQREVEDAFLALAREAGRPAVVIFDRGLMDGRCVPSISPG